MRCAEVGARIRGDISRFIAFYDHHTFCEVEIDTDTSYF